ncbi:uncharacterized protein EAF01_005431 [Botrytis porri]|uniref:Uncharacterized protein n=1 Tax=Botrytis porri TaxID=87229 RepID=A0A4Z1L012_9HELO|nr:uncharacterized protein EAF01_005431 [Botrytis porri]KAF7904909.1 hypothetical protein EAF01_005431 [Botrytis porri]TGO90040.1 hypothetical protein BPOR_0082g00160 [Botrytis porri]
MDKTLHSYGLLVTQLDDNESTSPDPPFNTENYNLEENLGDESSLSAVQPHENSPLSASASLHQPLGSSLPEVETPVRINQRQLVQSRPNFPRSNTEHSHLHTHVSLTHNSNLSPQDPSFSPLECPPYPTNDVNFDEWTNFAAYCGTAPEPELLNLLSNEKNASLHEKYFIPRSVDDINSENPSSCANKVTMRLRTHDFEVTTAQSTESLS